MSAFWTLLLWLSCVAASTEHGLPSTTLPATWFWGDVDGINFLTRVQNERAPRYCRASWALSTVAALSDRLKISNGAQHPAPSLSPQVLLNCVSATSNCSGGNPMDALEYISQVGIPDDTCENYEGKEGVCDAIGICRDCGPGNVSAGEDFLDGHCIAIDNFPLYRLEAYGDLRRNDETKRVHSMTERMKEEIYTNGSITCRIQPSTEFVNYKEGILSPSSPASALSTSEAHFINVVGWDATSDKKFWIGRNCWGESWGNGGFVQIEMGINAFGIESHCFWGTIAPSRSSNQRPNGDVNEKEDDHGPYQISRSRRSHGPCRCAMDIEGLSLPYRLPRSHVENADMPQSYDIRSIDGRNYAVMDKNQHLPVYCGSCWAFAAVSALADRYALLYKQDAPLFDLATQVVINCAEGTKGCRGGLPHFAYAYIQEHGLPHESCAPYQAIDQPCTSINICKSCRENGTCTASSEETFRHFSVEDYGVFIGEENMKQLIWSGGPVVCLVSYTSELHMYSGGIFNDTTGRRSFDHVVEVTGWGTESGVDYWIFRNSWGTYWGEQGWGRIAMGPGDLGLSSLLCSWATPKPFTTALPYQTFSRRQQIV